jgi:hypothetical protein
MIKKGKYRLIKHKSLSKAIEELEKEGLASMTA